MQANFRRLILDFLIYGSGDFLLRATAFITMPIYTRIFTPEDYGIWGYVSTLLGLFITIVGFGSNSVSNRFFFDAKEPSAKQLVVSTWFSFLTFWALVISLLLLPLSGVFSAWSFQTDSHAILFSLSLLTVPITLFNTLSGQLLRDQFQAKLSAALNVAATLLTILVILVLVVGLKLGLLGLALGNLLAALCMLPVRLWTARHFIRLRFSVNLLHRMLIFGAPLVPMAIAYWVFNVSDTILLGKLSTFEQVGLYTVAAKLVLVLSLINSAFGQAWVPHALQIYESEREQSRLFFGRSMTYILVCFSLLGMGVITFSPELLALFTAPAFYGAAAAIPPLVLAAIALSSTQITALSISLTKKTYYFTIFSILAALINIGLNFILLPRWGMVAAGWTTAVSYSFLTISYFIVSQRLWALRYETRKALTTLVLMISFGIGGSLISHATMPMSILVKLMYCFAYLLALSLFGVIGKREWNAIIRWKQLTGSNQTDSANVARP